MQTPVLIEWQKARTNVLLRRLRDTFHYTNADLAGALGISKSYLKKLMRARKPFELRANLRARCVELAAAAAPRVAAALTPKPLRVLSRYALRDNITNHVRAVRCRGHRAWHLFPYANQVYCNAECRKLFLARNARQTGGKKPHQEGKCKTRSRKRITSPKIFSG